MNFNSKILLSGFVAFLFGCAGSSKVEERSYVIAPPLKGVDVKFEQFVVAMNRDTTLFLPTGTEIHIPAGSIVDENGAMVDSATISFREFHSNGDVIVSGIPMVVVQGDSIVPFETAGMFEIDASWQSRKMKVNPQHPLNVELASNDSSVFDGYFLDSSSTTIWKKLGSNTVNVNARKKQILDSLTALLPTKPIQYDKNNDLILDVSLSQDDVNMMRDALMKYSGSLSKAQLTDLMQQDWYKTEVVKQGNGYAIILKGKKDVTLEVTPVYSAQNMAKAQKKYDEQIAKSASVLEQIAMQDKTYDMLRSFQVMNFGIYNSDRCAIRTDLVAMNPNFILPANIDKNKLGARLLIENQNTVVQLNEGMFKYDATARCALIVILPNNKIGYINANDFAKLHSNENNVTDITLQVSEGNSIDAQTIDKLIAI